MGRIAILLVLVVIGCAAGVLAAYHLARRQEPSPAPRPALSLARADRRAYDGAPPVIPHPPLGGTCIQCHAETARLLPGVGIAPPNPHLRTPGLSSAARCQQCHVFQATKESFVTSTFEPLAQDLRRGERLYPQAPPVIPHRHFMREDCAACHVGDASRPEIRCSHPERLHCLQCHPRGPDAAP